MADPRAFSAYPLPPVNDATLTCVGVRLSGDATEWIKAAMPFTTARERTHAGRFVHALDAARHLMGRAIVRRMLGAAQGLAWTTDFPRTPWGKPTCPPDGLGAPPAWNAIDFSITHSGDMVWAAFCQKGAVGMDVEQTRPIPDIAELAAQLHPQECRLVRSLSDPERTETFYRCWTRKEAVLKALGRGLSLPLHGFQVRTERDAREWLVSLPNAAGHDQAAGPAGWERECAAWTTRDIDVGPGYQCSVAASAPHLRVAAVLLENAGGCGA